MASDSPLPSSLCVIAERSRSTLPLPEAVARAVQGGARWIRVREPVLDLFAYCALCRLLFETVAAPAVIWSVRPAAWVVLRTACPEVRLAVHLTERDAVWVGSADVSATLVGRSVHDRAGQHAGHDLLEKHDGELNAPDYLLLAPIFATPSKPDAEPVGLARLQQLARQSAASIVALGGVTAEYAGACRAAGARGVAVCGGVLGTAAPDVAVDALLAAWQRS